MSKLLMGRMGSEKLFGRGKIVVSLITDYAIITIISMMIVTHHRSMAAQ
jgi:hypothetical protein